MQSQTKLPCLLDTSPLISLSAYQIARKPFIETIVNHADIYIVDAVAAEAVANPVHPDAKVIQSLINNGTIQVVNSPTTPTILSAYTGLGRGECGIIRTSLVRPELLAVMDDYEAAVVAVRFGVQPVHTHDLVVELVQSYGLDVQFAKAMINGWKVARRYSPGFIAHTIDKLGALS